MSIVPIMVATMMIHQNNQRMLEASRRRREDEERRRRKRREEERKREEEQRKMVEHRKNSAVVYNNESWQQDRCVKAITLQPCVQTLISTIEEVKPTIIEEEEKKYDEEIMETGYAYEVVRASLDSDIETLKKSGITISGSEYRLTRLTPTNTHIAHPEKITEFLGGMFTINGQTIQLNSQILSEERYFEDRYEYMNPEQLEQDYTEASKKMSRYQFFGKYLKFILRTRKYSELEEKFEDLAERHETCELRKRQMQSYQSLTKEQLLAIKSYFEHLAQLTEISDRLQKQFSSKKHLRDTDNQTIYSLALHKIMSDKEYSELVEQVAKYISKIQANDQETMQQAYELVKGEYPIRISRRFIYDLIITNLKNYRKEDVKELKLS